MVGYELHDARYVGQMVCITGPSISLSARHRPSLFTMCTLEITPAGMRRDSGRAMMEHYTYERRVKGTFSPILLKKKDPGLKSQTDEAAAACVSGHFVPLIPIGKFERSRIALL